MTDNMSIAPCGETAPGANIKLTAGRIKRLAQAAVRVRENAYSPYSKYKVGAALLAASGRIYTGANFENASFGAGTCAERVALGAALSAGERSFAAVCICGADSSITPCGICRQALIEFGDIYVICVAADTDPETLDTDLNCYRLAGLLPAAFGPAALENDLK